MASAISIGRGRVGALPSELTAKDVAQGVLLIVCDDLGHRRLKDNREATPVINALAAAGTSFNRAYSPHAICTPARASLLTGRLASTLPHATHSTARRRGRTMHRHFTNIYQKGVCCTSLPVVYPLPDFPVPQLILTAMTGRIRDIPQGMLPVDVSFEATFPRGQRVRTVASLLQERGFATGMFGKCDGPGSSTMRKATLALLAPAHSARCLLTEPCVLFDQIVCSCCALSVARRALVEQTDAHRCCALKAGNWLLRRRESDLQTRSNEQYTQRHSIRWFRPR